MAAVTIHSDFGAQENKVYYYLHFFPIYSLRSDGTRWHDLLFLNVEFKPAFSLSSKELYGLKKNTVSQVWMLQVQNQVSVGSCVLSSHVLPTVLAFLGLQSYRFNMTQLSPNVFLYIFNLCLLILKGHQSYWIKDSACCSITSSYIHLQLSYL